MKSLDAAAFDTHSIQAAPFVARPVLASQQAALAACWRLRYDYFVARRGWVANPPAEINGETDRYDGASYHLGVFEGDTLLAYLRALPWRAAPGFMLDHDFRCLISDAQCQSLNRAHGLEVSRLVLAPELSAAQGLRATELLFKLLYHCCLAHQVEHLYAVVEAGWVRRFISCFHLPFQPLGPPQRFPDGTRTVAVQASVRALEQALQTAAPQQLEWYQQP